MKQLTTIILILPAVLNFNCSSTKEITEIKPKVIYPAVVEDTVHSNIINDTLIAGVVTRTGHGNQSGNIASSQHIDTVVTVKYFPKLERFYIKVKPDSIIIFDTVKTVQNIEKIIETPFLSKIGLVMIGIIITCTGSYLIRKRG